MDVGVQVLRHARWSPECAAPQVLNVMKTLPPREAMGRALVGKKGL